MNAPSSWCGRPGLAAGLDRHGDRAAGLLAAGFGSVEFGTVTPCPEPDHNPGVTALAACLSASGARPPGAAFIGISLGMGRGALPAELANDWLAGLAAAWPVADYLSFNLSAEVYRPLLAQKHFPLLSCAIAAVAKERDRLAAISGRRVDLALKLPLGLPGGTPFAVAEAAAETGFDGLITVLPQGAERLPGLRALALRMRGGPALVAVGGIRNVADVRAALAAGAAGVQVHTAFAELGAACLPTLLGRSRDTSPRAARNPGSRNP